MSKYLRISSPGVAEVESFTVLGASSARSNDSSIGQFGSGAKHAILCALRSNIGMMIYCGKTKIVPQTQPQTIHGQLQERLQFRIDNRTEVSSMTLDFGSLDWTDAVPMMLREVISNALDAVGGVWDKITIDYVDKPRAQASRTNVFIELTEAVRSEALAIHKQFLHVNGEEEKKLLPQNLDPCRFYRKGVFVHEVEGAKALYSYNCGNELPIDESRNLDTHRVRQFSCELLTADLAATKHVLSTIVNGSESYESAFSYYSMNDDTVGKAFRELYGDDATVAVSTDEHARGLRKGLVSILIPSFAVGWATSLTGGDLPTTVSKLSKADNEGLQELPVTDKLVANVQTIWSQLEACGLIGSKELSTVTLHEFEKPVNAGESLHGFYDPLTESVWIHRDATDNWQVIIEELAHWITGANDETRDFQDYAFKLSAQLMRGKVGAE